MLHKKTCQVLLVAVMLAAVMGNGLAEAKTTHATPFINPQFTISALSSDETVPAIAYNSNHDEYLVVWENEWGVGGHHDIYAQRVSASGELLSWFAVASSSNDQTDPSVAYDWVNDRYLVVWSYDYYGDGSDWDIHGRLIPWNGPDAGLTDFSICNWTSDQADPDVVYARTTQEFMVVWDNLPGAVASYISQRLVESDGTFIHGGGTTVSSGTENRGFPAVTYNLHNNEYLVVWSLRLSTSNWDIYGVRLSGTGVALGSGEFAIAGWSALETNPAVAACDKANQYMVAWQSDKSTGETDYAIYARYLDENAALGNIYPIDDTTSPEINVDISCNAAGEQYMLAWQSRYTNLKYGIWAREAHSDESFELSFAVVPPGSSESRDFPAVSGGRGSSLFAWSHETNTDTKTDIRGRLYYYYGLYLPVSIRE
jgi:hypothetical protein